MIPMNSESCEWPFVGQNKNFIKLDEKLEVKSGSFTSSNLEYVKYLGVQNILQIGQLVVANLRLRTTVNLSTGALLGKIYPYPNSDLNNILFYNSIDNSTSAIQITTDGSVKLLSNATIGHYILDTSYKTEWEFRITLRYTKSK